MTEHAGSAALLSLLPEDKEDVPVRAVIASISLLGICVCHIPRAISNRPSSGAIKSSSGARQTGLQRSLHGPASSGMKESNIPIKSTNPKLERKHLTQQRGLRER